MAKKKNDKDWLLILLLLLFWLLKSGLLPFILLPGKGDKKKQDPLTPDKTTPEPTTPPATAPGPEPKPINQPTLEPFKIPSLDTLKKIIPDLPKKEPLKTPGPIQTPTPTPDPGIKFIKYTNPLEPSKLIKDIIVIGGISLPFVAPVILPIVGTAPVLGGSTPTTPKTTKPTLTPAVKSGFEKNVLINIPVGFRPKGGL